MPDTVKPLNDREQRFVELYLLYLNAVKAAIEAGYAESTANKKAFAWVGESRSDCPEDKWGVWNAVKAAIAARSERTKIDADWLLVRLADEATADIADLYDDNNNLKPVKQWPLIFRQGLVAGLDVEQVYNPNPDEDSEPGVVNKIKLSDRIKRLELIGRHVGVGAFKDVIDHNVKGDIRTITRRIVDPKVK